jgi:hypothetical protein
MVEFVCSDMWKPYLTLIAKHCPNALNILDRFHIVAKMNLALDDVRAAEARRMPNDGYQPVLKKSRWCLLKRRENLTDTQRIRLRDLLRYNYGHRGIPWDVRPCHDLLDCWHPWRQAAAWPEMGVCSRNPIHSRAR